MSLDVLLGYTGLPSLGPRRLLGRGRLRGGAPAPPSAMGFCAAAWWPACSLARATAAVFGLRRHPRRRHVLPRRSRWRWAWWCWGLAFRWVVADQGRQRHLRRAAARAARLRVDLTAPLPFFYVARWRRPLAWASARPARRARPSASACAGIRESESRMRAPRLSTCGCHKYMAFVLSGAVAGFAGVLWAYYNGFVAPDRRAAHDLGGDAAHGGAAGRPGTLVGPALGAGVIVFLKNFVSVYTKRWLLILGGRLHRRHPLRPARRPAPSAAAATSARAAAGHHAMRSPRPRALRRRLSRCVRLRRGHAGCRRGASTLAVRAPASAARLIGPRRRRQRPRSST